MALSAVVIPACSGSHRSAPVMGHALAADASAGMGISGMEHVRAGEVVFLLNPAIKNLSNQSITIVNAHLAELPVGLEEVSQATYANRPRTGVLVAWDKQAGAAANPMKLDPQALNGLTIPPNQSLPGGRFSMVEVRVTNAQPAKFEGLTVIYRQAGKLRKQTIPWQYRING